MELLENKRISVALATYNGEKYLQALLDSIERQIRKPDELIVSDDNSSDSTMAILEAYVKVASFPVRVVQNKERVGIVDNFARAFDMSSGNLIAYCDQDDVWHEDKLRLSLDPFADSSVKLVMHRSDVVDKNLESLGYSFPARQEHREISFPSFYEMSDGLGHQMLFDAEMYRALRWIFRQEFPELQALAAFYDAQFRFLAGMTGKIICLDDVLVKFRRHESATSGAGLGEPKEMTVSGFLNKRDEFYFVKSKELYAVAEVVTREIIPKMRNQQNTLKKYFSFVKKLGQNYQFRGAIYDTSSVLGRLINYLTLVSRFAYQKKYKGGFGHRALIVDAFVAMFGYSSSKTIIAKLKARL